MKDKDSSGTEDWHGLVGHEDVWQAKRRQSQLSFLVAQPGTAGCS